MFVSHKIASQNIDNMTGSFTVIFIYLTLDGSDLTARSFISKDTVLDVNIMWKYTHTVHVAVIILILFISSYFKKWEAFKMDTCIW